MTGHQRARVTVAIAAVLTLVVATGRADAEKARLRQTLRDVRGVAGMTVRTGVEIARLRLRPKREALTASSGVLLGRTALVTGGNAGIGKATAQELARKGARVILLSRNAQRGDDARRDIVAAVPDAQVSVVVADLADGATVDRAVAELKARGEKIDVLVNNAGGASVRHTEVDGVESTFAGNYLGHARLTLGLLDSFAPDVRVVNVTSALHRHSRADVDAFAAPPKYSVARAYADSKLALVYMTQQLSRRMASFAVDPGPVKTDFLSESASPFAKSIDVLRRGLGDVYRTPEMAARDLVGLITNPHKLSLSGQYLEGSRLGRPGAAAVNPARAAKLWRNTLDLLGIAEDPLGPPPSRANPAVTDHRAAVAAAIRTPLTAAQIAAETLVPEPNQPKLDGIRPKLFVRDSAGNRYVMKRDNVGVFGGPHEQRFATALLGAKGEPTIPTVGVRVDVDGKPVSGSVTPFVPNRGPLPMNPRAWTPMQQADVLRTAVWGHWLRNRDLHPGQFLVVDAGATQGAIAIDWEMAGRWRGGKKGGRFEGAPPSRHELMHPIAPPTAESSILRQYVRDPSFALDLDPMIEAAREIESLTEDQIRKALIDSGLHHAFGRGKGFGRFKTMDAFVASLMKDKQGLAARYEAYAGDLAQERATSTLNPRQLGRVARDAQLAVLDRWWGSKLGQKVVIGVQGALLGGEKLRDKLHGGPPPGDEPLGIGPAYRERLIGKLDHEVYDLVIIGGGVTGANALLEAQSRGLKALLVEANDFASGTSSRSTKLIHGGLRSLQQHRVGELREALRERSRLRNRTAPHLVTPEPFVIPADGRKDQVKLGLGVMVLNALDALHGMPRGRPLGKKGMAKWAPSVDPEVFDKGVLYYDASTDDARLVGATIRTAVDAGADALSYAPVVGLHQDAGGHYTGVVIEEAETGRRVDIQARHIVSAAGPWTAEVDALAGGPAKQQVTGKIRRATKGSHITVAGDAIPLPAGLIAKAPNGEVVIVHRLPDGTIDIGATKSQPAAVGAPGVTDAEAEELLAGAGAVMRPGQGITRDRVMSGQSAERPALIEEVNGQKTARGEDRRHGVFTERSAQGFTAIAGGKLTTASQMGEDVISAVFAHDPALRERAQKSVRGKQRLIGAQSPKERRRAAPELAARYGVSRAHADHLLGRYGSEASRVLDLMHADPALAEPLPGAPDYLLAEVAFAVEFEGARRIEDVLDRRTRVTLQTFHRGRESARAVAAIMAQRLGWDAPRTRRALDDFEAFLTRESGGLSSN